MESHGQVKWTVDIRCPVIRWANCKHVNVNMTHCYLSESVAGVWYCVCNEWDVTCAGTFCPDGQVMCKMTTAVMSLWHLFESSGRSMCHVNECSHCVLKAEAFLCSFSSCSMIASYIVTVTPKENPVLICPWEASPRQEEPDHAQTKFWLQRKMLPRNTFNFFHSWFF